MSNGKEHGYVLKSVTIDGKMKPVARFTCSKCPETIDITVKAAEPINGEACANTAKHRGWEADGRNPGRTLCPKCIADRPKHDPDAALKKFAARMPEPTPPAETQPTPIREPTADQRAAIRKLLEAHFDEDLGVYLDDCSDERIAAKVNVPRIVVERAREGAYGRIKITQADLQLRSELTTLRTALKNHMATAEELLEVLRADQAKLAAQIKAFEFKLGMTTPSPPWEAPEAANVQRAAAVVRSAG